MKLDEAKAMLKEIRELSGLASDEWLETYDTATGTPEISVKDRLTGRIEPIANVLPACGIDDKRLMTKAPRFIQALLVLLNQSFEVIRQAKKADDKRQPKVAAQCARKCGEPAFKKFLEERHGLEKPLTDDRVATKVRSILNIGSRAELNDDPAAAARWQNLRDHFEAWRRR